MMDESMERMPRDRLPAEAFGAVANEVRMAILRALFRADEPRSFSELRKDIDLSDSGRFNYHLGELDGWFVRKVDEGYRLSYAGRRIIGSIHSGIYGEQPTLEPIEAGECVHCGGQLRATYENELVQVTCSGCERTVTRFAVPPTVLNGFDRSELPLAFSRWVLTDFQRVLRGFCPDCSGRTRPADTMEVTEWDGLLGVVYTCDVCGLRLQVAIGYVVLDHPTVVAFHAAHGIDHRETLAWEIPWLLEPHASVTSRDPLRVRITPEIDGDWIALTVGGDMSVVSVDTDP